MQRGTNGPFLENAIEAEVGQIRLDAEALVALTHRFARKVVARGRGRILNVASTAGFQPGPRMTVSRATGSRSRIAAARSRSTAS